MLKLRRARVLTAGSAEGAEQSLTIALTDEDGGGRPRWWRRGAGGAQPAARAEREAIAQVALVGPSKPGDDVVVNVEARDLGLGSGGFDIVHVNLTRGLAGAGDPAAHVMKLNYTSLQHVVQPVEGEEMGVPLGRPTAVLALHGHLAPVAFAFAQVAPGARLGYVQTAGGALPGGHSRVVRRLREEGLLAGHVTAGTSFGGEQEAISTAGALHHGIGELGWDAAVCGPGPGIVGSNSALGHGGMAALDSAHSALALGCPTVVVARMSSADPRGRHRGLSHHTLTVLDLLLEPVVVALPAGVRSPVGAGMQVRPARLTRHDWRRVAVELPAYAQSGLPAETMGRSLAEDPLFFAAALAGGSVLAGLGEHSDDEGAERE